jgi:hypothetical protein
MLDPWLVLLGCLFNPWTLFSFLEFTDTTTGSGGGLGGSNGGDGLGPALTDTNGSSTGST